MKLRKAGFIVFHHPSAARQIAARGLKTSGRPKGLPHQNRRTLRTF
jgi:hypothetical protein